MKDMELFIKYLLTKSIKISKTVIFRILREQNYLYDAKDKWNQPKPEFIESKLFKSKDIKAKYNGEIYKQTFISKKGGQIILQMLIKLIENDQIEKSHTFIQDKFLIKIR